MKSISCRLAFCAAALAAFAAGCRAAPDAKQVERAAPTRTAIAVRQGTALAERDNGFLGVVLPRQSVDVAPEIAGRIEQVLVREGDAVRRGQTMAVLGAAEDRHELAMTEANLRAAEAEIARSRLEVANAENRLSRRLAVPEAFPQEEVRQAEIQKQMAEVTLERARAGAVEQRARVAQARDRLARAEVRAPADGTVARRYLEPGALTGPGLPVVRVISGASLIVRFAAPPERARSLRAAQRVVVEAGGAVVPAVIERVSPELDPPSGMVIVTAVLDPLARVKPGSLARVHPGSGAAGAERGG